MELLDREPLRIARSEIGSNRKHRGNRFLTVIQYALDMSECFVEMHRTLKPGATAIVVVGRESRVRGVRFLNGALLAEVATQCAGFAIAQWEARSFTNRFGVVIVEDVLTLTPARAPLLPNARESIARAAAVARLSQGMSADPAVRQDIAEAIGNSHAVKQSPLYLAETEASEACLLYTSDAADE